MRHVPPVVPPLAACARTRLALLPLLIGLSGDARAADVVTVCSAGCDYPTIKAALDDTSNLPNGSTVQVTEVGTYTQALDFNGRSLIVESTVGRGVLVSVASNDQIRVRGGATVVLRGISVGEQARRGIRVEGATTHLTLDDVEVRNNTRNVDGPGLHVSAGTVVITGSDFVDNASTGNDHDGAHVFVTNSGNLHATNTHFSTGKTEDSGAVYVTGSTATFVGGSFTGNEATEEDGGALHVRSGSVVTITGTTFTDNLAARNGAAIYANGSTLTVNHATFAQSPTLDDAAVDGGAIYVQGGSLEVNGGTFTDLHVAEEGAGIYGTGGSEISVDGATVGRSVGPGRRWRGRGAACTSTAPTRCRSRRPRCRTCGSQAPSEVAAPA